MWFSVSSFTDYETVRVTRGRDGEIQVWMGPAYFALKLDQAQSLAFQLGTTVQDMIIERIRCVDCQDWVYDADPGAAAAQCVRCSRVEA